MTDVTAGAPATITLGGNDFPVAPLTLGDMRRAGPAFARIGIDTTEGVDAQITLVYLAMRAANPQVTPDSVSAIPGVTFDELKAAIEVVGRLTGVEMRKPSGGEAVPGEAVPAEAPATA